MLNQSASDVTPGPVWWERIVGPVIDVVEDRILDPIDLLVTPRIERHRARTAHQRVSEARRTAEARTVASWPIHHDRHAYAARSRLLHTWAELESAASRTLTGLHEHHAHSPAAAGRDCASLIQLYADRAELLRALAVMEEQTTPIPGRSPHFGAMPVRMRTLAEGFFADMAKTCSSVERAEREQGLAGVLTPDLGAAVAPIRRVYIG